MVGTETLKSYGTNITKWIYQAWSQNVHRSVVHTSDRLKKTFYYTSEFIRTNVHSHPYLLPCQ